jgi:hypothetical protein
MVLKLDNDKGLIEAALAIATERENTTRALARAVLTKDYDAAVRLAKELIPNEADKLRAKRKNPQRASEPLEAPELR